MDNELLTSKENKKTLISVLGWEDRFYKGIEYDFSTYNVDHLLLLVYQDYFNRDNFKLIMKSNLDKISEICESSNITLKLINLNYSDEIENYNKIGILKDEISYLNTKDILIDITTIPREVIWNILSFSLSMSTSVELIYHKPKDYDSWLCKNFEKPLLQMGHSGISKFGIQTALIVITGFEAERTKQLINHFEPDVVFLCVQTGQQFENTKRNIESHKTFYTPNLIEFREMDSYNIKLGAEILNNIVSKLDNYNIIIASQGPKTSSVIAYNVFLNYSNIGLAYVPSKDININYSKGIDDNIKYKLK